MLLAALMVITILPVEALAVTSIKGAYVGQKFGLVIDVVNNATSYSISGEIPDGLTASGTYTSTNDNYALSLALTGTPKTAGTYNFRVNYYKPYPNDNEISKTVSYIMTVGENAPFAFVKEDSLYIESWPKKTEYYLHDTLDTTGMKVVVTAYKLAKVNGNEKTYEPFEYDITDLCSVTPTYFTQDDVAISCVVSCTLPVDTDGTLKTLTGTFRVTFKEADPNTVTGMELLSAPTKLTYTKGESLNTSGLTLRLKKYIGIIRLHIVIRRIIFGSRDKLIRTTKPFFLQLFGCLDHRVALRQSKAQQLHPSLDHHIHDFPIAEATINLVGTCLQLGSQALVASL